MSAPSARTVRVNGHDCRILEKGSGEPLGYLPGAPGLVRWTEFADRLAERRRLIVPSLPGFLGGQGHHDLDTILDWTVATLDLLEASGLHGADLVASSVGGMLACEVAAVSRPTIRSLALVAPYGIYDDTEPTADPFTTTADARAALLSARPEALAAYQAPPEDPAEAEEFGIHVYRGMEAAARITWPFGDRGLVKRLHRVHCPTLLVWGSDDRLIPASYAKRFADRIAGDVQIRSIAGAGHTAEIDAPDAVADAILDFLA